MTATAEPRTASIVFLYLNYLEMGPSLAESSVLRNVYHKQRKTVSVFRIYSSEQIASD